MNKVKTLYLKIADNRLFCIAWLIIGAVYILWYGFLENPLYHTASAIAAEHRKLFYLWVLFAVISLSLNVKYMYRHNDYEGNLGKRLLYASFFCIAMTVIVPYADSGVQMRIHWSAAFSFAILCFSSIILFLIRMFKKNRRYLYVFLFLIFVLLMMLLWLKFYYVNAVFESLAMLCIYSTLFVINFTGMFRIKAVQPKLR